MSSDQPKQWNFSSRAADMGLTPEQEAHLLYCLRCKDLYNKAPRTARGFASVQKGIQAHLDDGPTP